MFDEYSGISRRLIGRLIVVLAVLISCAALPAQVILSTIRGTALDATGAVIVNAEIALVHQETNARRTAATNQNGDYELAGLRPGTYRLSVTSAGFKTAVVENIILQSSEVRRVNVTLDVGAVGSELTVTAGAAVISTESARVEGSVTGRTYPDAPFVNVNSTFLPQYMLTTMPMIQQTGAVWSAQWAGQSTTQIQQGQDGHTNDGFANQTNDIFDVEEIAVVTGNPTADVARVGYFNQITKSGSNQFHGVFLYQHVNPLMAARPFFAASKVKTLQHTFANGVSGPIVKNKTFFYTSFNIGKIPTSQYFLQTVPTTKMRAGDFSQLLGLARPVTVRDPLSGAPFPGNAIPASRVSPLSLKVNEKYLPAPNRGGSDDLANNFGFTFPYPADLYVRADFTVRIDHHFSASNRVMFRLVRDQTLYILNANSLPGFEWTRKRNNYHIVGEDTHVFSPNLVNAARMGWYREGTFDGGDVYGHVPFKGDEAVKYLGLQGVNPQNLSAQGFPRMNITGLSSLYTQPGGPVGLNKNWGFADTMAWSKGKHMIKFGAEYKPQSNVIGNVKDGTYGVFDFNGTFSGYGYGDLMLGLPYSSTRLNQLTNRKTLDSEFGAFITDDFKVSKRLTLSLGVRWDRFGSPRFKDGLMWNWDLANGNIVVPEASRKAISPLYPPTIKIASGQVRQNPSNRNIAPRFGAAYRLSDRLVVRGAYGIYTETLSRFSRLNATGPFEISETYYNQVANGQPLFSFPNPFPSSIASAAIPSQSFTGYPLDTRNGRIHQFNFTLERQIGDIGLRLTYLGSRNRGMNYSLTINKPQPSLTTFTQARRPWPAFVGGAYFRSDGQQNYNAMTFEVQRKMGQVTFNGHWTFASNYSNMLTLENPYVAPGWNRDPNTSRHRAVVNVVWRIPIGRGQRFLPQVPAVADHLLGGWQLYWITFMESGRFFTPSFSGSDPSNTNTSGGRPDRVCDGNYPAGQRTINRWFNAACFAVPAAGQFGNSAANVLVGPGNYMHNISIAKTFSLTERVKFTFTAAALDAFNHPNFGMPASNISSPGNVGTINSLTWSGGYRVMEVRGRLAF
jgi:hypothetical protein